MRESSITPLRSTLFVSFFWLLSIGIVFAKSPNQITFQATCSGPANGSWIYSAKEHGSCTCPQSLPLPSFAPTYLINVCQNGNSLSGSTQAPNTSQQLRGSVSGQQVNFTAVTKFTINSQGTKVQDTLNDTSRGTLHGNTISGTVSSDWHINVTGGGENISCGCNLSGTFNVQLNGGGGGGGGGNETKTVDVSQSSGIAKQTVETTGVQWTDINKDGKLDLFMAGKNGNALFKNVGAGHFTPVDGRSHATQVGDGGISSLLSYGAAWADFDNDGDQDLMLCSTTLRVIFLQNTNGNFVVTPSPTSLSPAGTNFNTTLAGIWLDFNNDGKVDAVVVKDGAPNQLFKNLGGGHFQDVAAAAHVNVTGPGRGAVSADFNGDGLADLYIVNFRAPNKMFINNGNGTFRATSAAPFSGASVQAIVGDYNNDKRFDILVVNNEGPSVLFKNIGNDASGNPKFAKANVGISGATHGRGAAFGDFNNDGLLDLVLIQSEGGNILFLNNGNSTFSSLPSVSLNNPHFPTALITGDFDNDGLIDIMIGDGSNTQTGGDSLYKNASSKNHWLEISLQGTTSNRSAINAVIVIRNGDTFQSQQVSGGNGSSQDSLVMHFGLGTNTKVDEMDILWPSGVLQRCLNVNANRKIQVTEGNPSGLGCQ